MGPDREQMFREHPVHKHFVRLASSELPSMLKSREATEEYLRHPNPKFRGEALYLLNSYWNVADQCANVYETMAQFDANVEVRSLALGVLGSIYKKTNNARMGAILAHVVKDGNAHIKLREAAYISLYDLRGVDIRSWPPFFEFQLLRDVDWTFVNSFLAGEKGDIVNCSVP